MLPTFSSMRLSVVAFMLRSLLHLDKSFVLGDRYGSISNLIYVDIQLFQHHLLNMLSFFHFFLCQNQVFVALWIDIQVFDTVPLLLLSVFMPIPDCF